MLELNLKGVEDFIEEISSDVASNIISNDSSVIDFDTADFEVDGKEIKLVAVNLEEWYIKDIIEDVLKTYFKEYLEES